MSGARKTTAKVGDLIEVADPAVVVRPDDVEVTVTGGSYVLSMPGLYVIDGDKTEAK